MTVPMTTAAFGLWARACVQAVGAARAEVDALNVFPVPDGDTGTNVFLTFEAAAAGSAPLVARGEDVAACARAFAHGALVGAKGNSGVIMAQLLRAMLSALDGVVDDPHAGLGGHDVARALRLAATAAHRAVGTPVEGTILTVAAAAASGAERAADDGADAAGALAAACASARDALARTPSQLPRLAEAGVVDAGGRALVVVLEATERVLTGRWEPGRELEHVPVPTPHPVADADAGPAFEVMYLLESDDDAVDALRERLGSMGDSVVVVGGEGTWNVHAHVDDAGGAIEAGLEAGRPYRIAVTHLHEAVRPAVDPSGRLLLAVTVGAGLTTLFTEAGATTLPVEVGAGVQARQVVEAVEAGAAAEVVLLPNGADHVAPCEAAAHQLRDAGRQVAVVPTRTQVQGIAAVAVHDPGRRFADDVVTMADAAGHTQHGAVTFADAHGITTAGPCAPGDVLGVVAADFAFVGDDVAQVAFDVVGALLSGSSELVTLVTGEGLPDHVVQDLQARVRATWPYLDTVVHDGGQRRYPLLVGVE